MRGKVSSVCNGEKRRFAIAVFLLLLAGIASNSHGRDVTGSSYDNRLPTEGTIRVMLRSNAPEVKPGEEITLAVETDRDCLVSVVYLGASGKVLVLWPEGQAGWRARMSSGRLLQLPAPGSAVKFVADGRHPYERFIAIATSAETDLFRDSDFASSGDGVMRSFRGSEGEFEQTLQQRIRAMSQQAGWGTARLEVRVASSGQQTSSRTVSQRADHSGGRLQTVSSRPRSSPTSGHPSPEALYVPVTAGDAAMESTAGYGGLRPQRREYGDSSQKRREGTSFSREHSPWERIVPVVPTRSLEDDSFIPKGTCNKDNPITRVSNTEEIPWMQICKLIITFPNTKDTYGCTGFFVGPRTVATCGHCVYSHEHGGWATSIEVVPGCNGETRPYGSQFSSELRSVTQFTEQPDQQKRFDYDYGAVILPDQTLSERVGYFGFKVASDADLNQLSLNVAGYPGRLPDGKPNNDALWHNFGPVSNLSKCQIETRLNWYGGHSGSPVWLFKQDENLITVLGVAASEKSGTGCPNSATRINGDVFKLLLEWKVIPEDTVRNGYCRVLERAVDTSGMETYIKQLQNGWTVKKFIRDLTISPEHTDRFIKPNSPERAVEILYDHLLCRSVDASGAKTWPQVLREKGVAAVVDGILDSEEYMSRFGEHNVPGNGRSDCGKAAGPSTYRERGLDPEPKLIPK